MSTQIGSILSKEPKFLHQDHNQILSVNLMVLSQQHRIFSALPDSLRHPPLGHQAKPQRLGHLLEDQHLVNHRLLAQRLIHLQHRQLSVLRHSLALEGHLDSLHKSVQEAPLDNHLSLEEEVPLDSHLSLVEEVPLDNLLH